MLNSFSVASTTLCMHLAGMVLVVLLFLLIVLTMGFTQCNYTKKTTSGVEECLAKSRAIIIFIETRVNSNG
ncbi:hypothetical protein HMPREF2874_02430 [Rothia sp. HMSC068F09]|nr:hypothetical protein HMPREF2874_02430 [Rothia sp. HMSC068F09]